MVDKRICDFIARHHVMTLATVSGSVPWCSNLFYAFDSERMNFVFTSSTDTRHIIEGLSSPVVACSIAVDSVVVGRLQGLQVEGILRVAEGEFERRCRGLYLRRFPFAALHLECMWSVEISTLKFTDNTLGFGKKLYFKR